jgi:hypothetical protein
MQPLKEVRAALLDLLAHSLLLFKFAMNLFCTSLACMLALVIVKMKHRNDDIVQQVIACAAQ